MKKTIKISIPSPCNENWQQMTPIDKGRFCASCQKNVIDFSNASDREIATTYKKNKNTCGRFRTSQLNRDLIVPKEKSTLWMAVSAAFVSFIGLGSHHLSAQTLIDTEQHDSKANDLKSTTPIQSPFMITGTVTDEFGMYWPGAKISIRNTDIKIEITDINGNFSLKVNQGDVLIITAPFAIMQYLTIIKPGKVAIKLKDDNSLQDMLILGEPE